MGNGGNPVLDDGPVAVDPLPLLPAAGAESHQQIGAKTEKANAENNYQGHLDLEPVFVLHVW